MNLCKSHLVRVLFGLLLLSESSGCFPYVGLGKKEIPTDPITFVDQETGEHIQEVLVVPRYLYTWCLFSSNYGHGDGAEWGWYVAACPFVYKAETAFDPFQPVSWGIVWGPFWAFTGCGAGMDGCAAFAPGYEPEWVWQLWKKGRRISLRKAQSESSEKIRRVFRSGKVTGRDAEPWGLAECSSIKLDFSEDERRLIREFLD